MKLAPVYPHLTNTLMTDTGIEFYPISQKALSIAHLMDHKANKTVALGFLFGDVQSISYKLKNKQVAEELGCEIGLPNFLYSGKLDEYYNRYVFHAENAFIIVEAKKVELIEGLLFA